MKKYNLIVVGGGISGVAAAVSAAREGLSVLLVEKFGCLGGAMSNSLVFPFMRYTTNAKTNILSDGIFTEMRKRHEAYNDTSWETYKFVFDDMITESGATVIFHSAVIDATVDGREIKSVKIATKAGIIEVEADFFVDASGDGELIAMTGCEYQLGRESDGLSQPMTTCFRLGNVDIDRFKQDRPMLEEKYKELQAEGKILNPRENLLVFFGLGEGIVHFNTTRIIKHNPVDPFEISEAEIAARRQVTEMVDFFRAHSTAFENSTVVSVANHIGVRESRKLKGVYILTAEDLTSFVRFEDTIALGAYAIDIHNPGGTGTIYNRFGDDEYYNIPYRSLQPKEYDNMLVAGRCLSATHEAHSAVRIMPICACLGEAAGTAVAIAHKTGRDTATVDIKAVQDKLRENGAAIW